MTRDNAIDGTLRRYHFPPLNSKPPEVSTAPLQQTIDADQLQHDIAQMKQSGFVQGHEQGYQSGRNDGYEEGRQLGREEGLREARSHLRQAVNPVDALIEQLRQTLDQYDQRRCDELLLLVENVARQVIQCELALQPSQLLALVEKALSSLPEAPKRLQVLLNPDEFIRIQELAPEKVAAWGMASHAGLEAGECRIVTEVGEMDIGCNHRLEQCIDALGKSLSAPSGGEGVLSAEHYTHELEK